MLGGSSAINGQAFVSASKGETREHLGLKWVGPSVHGFGFSGPIQASFPGEVQNPLVKAWVDISKNIGYEATADPYSGASLLPGKLSQFRSESCKTSPSPGHVHISSANPNDKQTIDPRYFSHPLDIEILARNLLELERLHQNEALAKYFKMSDGRRNHLDSFLTDLELAKKYFRDTVTTSHHFAGTATMLPEDKGGVVSAKLVVHGTVNLRV
ncbi:hypothetical protein RJ035_000225 [Blastomyces gilchristii]